MAWYDNYTPLVGDTYSGPVDETWTTVNWEPDWYNPPSTFDYYYYETPEIQIQPITIKPIDFTPQTADIKNKITSQLSNIQNQISNMKVIVPTASIAPYINQTPLVGQTNIQITPLEGVTREDITRYWAENQVAMLETIGTQYATMAKTQKELDDIIEMSLGSLSYVGDVYDKLATAIKVDADAGKFKLIPLASSTVESAMEELKWRTGKIDLNSILPKIATNAQKILILEDYTRKRVESLQKSGELKINPYDLAKQYTNANPDAIAQIFQQQKTPVDTNVIARIQNGTATRTEINALYGITRTIGVTELMGQQGLQFTGYQSGEQKQVNNILYDPKRQRLNYSYTQNGRQHTKEIIMSNAEFNKLQEITAKLKPWIDRGKKGTPESDKTLTNVAAVIIEGIRINVGDEETALRIGEALNGMFNMTVTASVTDKYGDSRVLDKFEWRDDYQISGNVISAPEGMAFDMKTGQYVKTQETLKREKIAEEQRKQTAQFTERIPGVIQIGDNITMDFNNRVTKIGDTEILMSTKEIPLTVRKMESYTKFITEWANNEDNAALKTIAIAVNDLVSTDKQKLINGGYADSRIVTSGDDIANKEWSPLDAFYMLGKAMKSETSHQLFGTERLSYNELWAGQTVVNFNSKGYNLAKELGNQWAEKGTQTNNLGLSDTAVKQFVMENADSNTIANVVWSRPKDVAIMATNALTRSSVNQALSAKDISTILAENPLTDSDRNQMLKDQAYQIGAVVTDFDVTGTPADLVLGIAGLLTGGFIGETDLAAKGIKLMKASKTAGEVSDLLNYAKTATIAAKNSDLANNAILTATKAANIAVVMPSPGTIARGVTTNSVDFKKAASIDITSAKAPLADKVVAAKATEYQSIIQKAAAQPSVVPKSILTTPNTKSMTNAQVLVTKVATDDPVTVRAVLVEQIATDPSALYHALTVGAVKSDPVLVKTAFQRWEDAKEVYVNAANDFVGDIVDRAKVGETGQIDLEAGAERLVIMSAQLGDGPVIKMLDTAMNMGPTPLGGRIEPTQYINEITNIRNEWEAIRGIAAKVPEVQPTGARLVSQQAYDIENVMPDVIVARINRVSPEIKINRIENIAEMTDAQISDLSKRNIGLTEQDILNYREKASQILGKEGTTLEDVTVTAFKQKETASWSLAEKDVKLDEEYKALYSADNLKSAVTAKKKDIEKLQTAAQRAIGRPLDTMDDFKSLTDKEIASLHSYTPSVSHSDIVGYRIKATKEMGNLSPAKQTYAQAATSEIKALTTRQTTEAKNLQETADEYRNLLRKADRTDADEYQMGQLGVKLEEQRKALELTSNVLDAKKTQIGQSITKTTPLSSIEGKKVKLATEQLNPGTKPRNIAAKSAIDAAKKGDYETAIKNLAESKTHDGRSVFSKVDAKNYEGMSIQRINRMEDAIPGGKANKGMKEMLEQMRKERRDYAIGQLGKKGVPLDDFKRMAFKIAHGDNLDEMERLKLWNSGDEIRALAKDALDDVGGNKLIKGLVDDARKAGDKTRAKNLQRSMVDEAKKCIANGECAGGGFGGAAAILIGAAAIAGAGALTGRSEATIYPGIVNINEGTASPISETGYKGTIPASGWKSTDIGGTKVEGSEEGMKNFQDALNWVKSSENTVAKTHEYDSTTDKVGERERDGTIQSIYAPEGRGNTYMCEQYTKDTATALEKQGIKDVYIALTGKETIQDNGGKYTTGHSFVAIKTGERQDLMTGKMVPVFALIETITGKDLGRTYMLGTGTPITNVGGDPRAGNGGIDVDQVTLIKASDFIDVGTNGIALPNAEVIQYTPEVEYMQAMSQTMLSTPEGKMGGTLATTEGIESAVASGRITQEDASRLKSAQGLN